VTGLERSPVRNATTPDKSYEALAKYREALKYAPHWQQLQEASEAVAKS